MASLQEALAVDRSGYQEVIPDKPGIGPMQVPQDRLPAPNGDQEPYYNAMIRCPLPPVSVTPDSLRQFFTGGKIPQVRLLTPPNTNQGSGIGGTTTVNQTTIVQNTSGGGSSTPSLSAKTASVTSSVLSPNAKYTGVIIVAKSFQLLSVSANNPCRVELYGTAAAQSIDFSRGLDTAPAAGTTMNLITDVALDTTPFSWNYQNRIGANGDSPQSSVIYVSVTNIGASATSIIATLSFVPLES